MKFLLLFLMLAISLPAPAAQFTIEWDDENITGTVTYKVYTQREGGFFESQIAGLLVKEFTFEDEASGPISIYVTAVSVDGIESPPSNTITTVIPSAPNNLRIRVRVALQSSGDMQTWTTVAKYDVPESNRVFYRIQFTP